MPDFLTGIGIAGVNNLLNFGFGNLTRYNNYKYNEMSAENADKRTRALYNDLYSPQAQLQQLKKAGLSPSLFYGQAGGISGQAGAQGAGAAGPQTSAYNLDPLTLSQIELNESQANKNNAEAEQTTQTTAPTVAKLWEEAGAAKASKNLMETQTEGEKLANYVANAKKDIDIYRAASLAHYEAAKAEKACWEAEREGLSFEYDKETFETRVQLVTEQKAKLIAETAFLKSKKQLTDQEKQESIARIAKMYQDTLIGWANVDAAERNADAYNKWVDGKLPYIEKELDIEAKRLDVENTRMWVNFAGDVIKGGATLVGAGLLKGKGGGLGNPVYPATKPTPTKLNKYERGLNLEKYKEIYDY